VTQTVDTVLFDLDGTISDSAPGILSSLQIAFAEHDVAWPDEATARSFLGPPFHASLPPFVGEENLPSVIEAYRRRYVGEKGMFNTVMYAGIADLLAKLHADGFRLALATSKPEPLAVEILGHLGAAHYFTEIGGDTFDGARGTKALVVKDVLARLGSPAPENVIMVGDRRHDVEGGRENELRTVGVLWGYGDHAELHTAGAWKIIAQPADLTLLL
jgi:phosphoglycolate phosphatase